MLLTKVLGRVARSPSSAAGYGPAAIAPHVFRCHPTRDTRVQNAFDNVASNNDIRQALLRGEG